MNDSLSTAIHAVGLAKEYRVAGQKPVVALSGLDLHINGAEIYALLGPNGAGKTTTISLLTTLIVPSSGTATVAGYDVVKESAMVRRNIGLTFQESTLDQELTGRQVLEFHGRLYGMNRDLRRARIAETTKLVGLFDVLDRRVSTYSGGMKRRLELSRGLMTKPKILFLDEPTQGLDPQNRVEIWRHIKELRDVQGLTLLLTTHNMEEAGELADRVGIIDQGQLVVQGPPDHLTRDLGSDIITMSGQGRIQSFVQTAGRLAYVTNYYHQLNNGTNSPIQLGVDNGDRRLPELITLAVQEGVTVSEVRVTRPSLADVFLHHTGRQLRDP